VLPCANLSGDPEQEYFSDGLTEELTGVLAGMHSLRVVARTSAFAFKGDDRDIREIAGILDVGTILECSVRRAGERVRVTAQLINAADGLSPVGRDLRARGDGHLCHPDRSGAAHCRCVEGGADAGGASPAGTAADNEPGSTRSLSEGSLLLEPAHESGYARAIEYYERAIAADPGYAEAYAGLATVTRCRASSTSSHRKKRASGPG
jgi:adenylate cyclase